MITDEATLEIAAAIVHELEKLGAPYRAWVLEDLAERPLKDLPREIAGGSGDQPGFDLCGAGAEERTALAHADDRCGEPAEDPARAHGEHQPADHAGRHAGGFSEGGPAERESCGDGAQGTTGAGEDCGGNGPDGGFESELQVAEDQRDYHSGKVGEPAGRGNFYDAGRGEWDVRDRRRGGGLFVREVWQFAGDIR